MNEGQAFADQIGEYFRAIYGQDYVYRAPELFPPLERWMLAVASGNVDWGQKVLDGIVKKAAGR